MHPACDDARPAMFPRTPDDPPLINVSAMPSRLAGSMGSGWDGALVVEVTAAPGGEVRQEHEFLVNVLGALEADFHAGHPAGPLVGDSLVVALLAHLDGMKAAPAVPRRGALARRIHRPRRHRGEPPASIEARGARGCGRRQRPAARGHLRGGDGLSAAPVRPAPQGGAGEAAHGHSGAVPGPGRARGGVQAPGPVLPGVPSVRGHVASRVPPAVTVRAAAEGAPARCELGPGAQRRRAGRQAAPRGSPSGPLGGASLPARRPEAAVNRRRWPAPARGRFRSC